MQLRYNYRLCPSPGQRTALARAFGCARVVFNDALRIRQEAFAAGLPFVTDADLSARLTAIKATPERMWLTEVSAVVLQQALADLNTACRNYFASIAGKRRGTKMEPPRFRSRKDRRQAVRFTANARWKVTPSGKLRLPKIGDVQVRWSRELQAVYVEDLCVAGLARTRLAKSVHDAGWSAFTGMLEYKARRYGRWFGKIGRFVPSTGPCSGCGVNGGRKPLHVRQWTCTACGAVQDRDLNAAKNILAAGLADRLNACGGDVRQGPALAVASETGTLPKPRRKAT
jgi:transposase